MDSDDASEEDLEPMEEQARSGSKPRKRRRRRRPGACWFVWSALNNERLCNLVLYLTALVLTLAVCVLDATNTRFTIVDGDNNERYADALFPPFATAFEVREVTAPPTPDQKRAVVVNECFFNADSLAPLFTSSGSGFPGYALGVLLCDIFALLLLCVPVGFSSLDVAGWVHYERMAPGYKLLLFGYAFAVLLALSVVALMATMGGNFYATLCVGTFLDQYAKEDADNAAIASATVSNVKLFYTLAASALPFALLPFFCFWSLFSTQRSWRNTEGFDLVASASSGSTLAMH